MAGQKLTRAELFWKRFFRRSVNKKASQPGKQKKKINPIENDK